MTQTLDAGLMADLTGRDLLRIGDLTRDELEDVLDLAAAIKKQPDITAGHLQGRTVAMYFNKPSTRTRVSFVQAAHHLGLFPLTLGPEDLQLSRGETIADTARTLSQYAAAIVVRTFAQSDVEELARHADIPVVNALTDEHHPCQALADVLTIREQLGAVEGVRVAFVGDFNNVARSLADAVTLLGGDVVVASPPELSPSSAPQPPDGARGSLAIVDDVYDAVMNADVIYTDVWISMGDQDEDGKRALLRRYQVNDQVMRRASARAVFMHCLPAHRGEEVTAQVIDGPSSVVWAQAFNRLPTEEAILFATIRSHREA